MRKIICMLLTVVLSLTVLTGCRIGRTHIEREIEKELGIDVSKGKLRMGTDTHGGFFGDGQTVVVIEFGQYDMSGAAVLEQIADRDGWEPLPFSENLEILAYGLSEVNYTVGPYMTSDSGKPVLPEIENGYYYFRDNHAASTDSHDDTDVLSRSSMNFTVAVYDTDTDTLYYVKFDT